MAIAASMYTLVSVCARVDTLKPGLEAIRTSRGATQNLGAAES